MGRGFCTGPRPPTPVAFRVVMVFLGAILATSGAPARVAAVTSSRTAAGGLGVSWIDGRAYYDLLLQPEFALGPAGLGLDVDMLVDTETGRLRHEDLETAKMLSYLRVGRPEGPLYARLGALEETTLGHGFLIYRYRNQAVENRRRLGLELGAHANAAELRIITNDVGRVDLFGGRGAVAPLAGAPRVGPLSRVRVGVTFLREEDEDDFKANGVHNINVMGGDLELPLTRSEGLRSRVYYDYGTILDHGSGREVGLGAESAHVLGALDGAFSLERRWDGAHFLPRYFDYAYERERYDFGTGVTKSDLLDSLPSRTETAAELSVSAPRAFSVLGSCAIPDASPHRGIVHLEAWLPACPSLRALDLSSTYDRKEIANAGEIFKLDDHSLWTFRALYALNRWLRAGMQYEWTYRWESSEDRYRSIGKVTPALFARATL